MKNMVYAIIYFSLFCPFLFAQEGSVPVSGAKMKLDGKRQISADGSSVSLDLGIGNKINWPKALPPANENDVPMPAKENALVAKFNNEELLHRLTHSGMKIPDTDIYISAAKADNCPHLKCDDSAYAYITLNHGNKIYGANVYKIANYKALAGSKTIAINGAKYTLKLNVRSLRLPLLSELEVSKDNIVILKAPLLVLIHNYFEEAPVVNLGNKRYYVVYSPAFNQSPDWELWRMKDKNYLVFIEADSFGSVVFVDYASVLQEGGAEFGPPLSGYLFEMKDGQTLIYKKAGTE